MPPTATISIDVYFLLTVQTTDTWVIFILLALYTETTNSQINQNIKPDLSQSRLTRWSERFAFQLLKVSSWL